MALCSSLTLYQLCKVLSLPAGRYSFAAAKGTVGLQSYREVVKRKGSVPSQGPPGVAGFICMEGGEIFHHFRFISNCDRVGLG